MEILTPEDRIALWRMAIDREGSERVAVRHAVAKEIVDSLSALNIYDDEHLVTETLDLLDLANLLSRDEVRLAFEALHEQDDAVASLASELIALLKETAGVSHLDQDVRVRALELAAAWQDHMTTRPGRDATFLTVADVAAKFQVTTQAVYKWLNTGKIDGERRPGGSWRIPAAQFGAERPFDSARSLELQKRLIKLHGESPDFSDEEIARALADDAPGE